jgi:diguanylate cyclase (GGDEF)-like protein/PAS domain S-box-containing protein
MEHLAVATFVLDRAGRVLIWNKACERLTGIPASEMVGASEHWKALYSEKRPCLADLMLEKRLEEAKNLYEAWSDTEVNPEGLSAENWCVMPRLGKRRYLAFDVGPIYDESGSVIAIVETIRDLTSHKEMESELEELAGRDPLTRLANRRTFDLKLTEEWKRSKRSGEPLSLLLIDVDHFKQYNDAYGHPSGDRCLEIIAEAVGSQAFRAGDVAARIGGEEFAIILPQTPNDGALVVAERLREAVESSRLPHCGSPTSAFVTLSIGVKTLEDGEDVGQFAARADSALYEAKHNGRNRVHNQSPDVSAIMRHSDIAEKTSTI